MAHFLVVDDEPPVCRLLCSIIHRLGHSCVSVETMASGLNSATHYPFDAIFLDVNLPDGNGLDIIDRLRQTPSKPEVIIFTGTGDANGAELAIRNGAWNYLQKPIDQNALMLELKRVLQFRSGSADAVVKPVTIDRKNIIGNSREMEKSFAFMGQAAAMDSPVLILGETGTGKELFARAIHDNSNRSKGNFVVVDCAALPENLAESILFGHEKGAFTGAEREHRGLIHHVDGGTLFLDEIGELSPALQKIFLRLLQEKTYRRVGGTREYSCDFRLVSATHRDINEMETSGAFRSDLLFRIKALQIDLPPLRSRKEDIKPLVFHFVERICSRLHIAIKGFAPEFFEMLDHYPWPGNVRELIHVLENAVAASQNQETLFPQHLPDTMRIFLLRRSIESRTRMENNTVECDQDLPSFSIYRKHVVQEAENRYLKDLAARAKGDLKMALTISGLSRSRFYDLLKIHQIQFGEPEKVS
jgi:two-component system, NtrC family, response regulator